MEQDYTQTEQLIAQLKAAIAPSSVTPVTVGNIFTSLLTNVKGLDTLLEGFGVDLSAIEESYPGVVADLAQTVATIASHTSTLQAISQQMTAHLADYTRLNNAQIADAQAIVALQQKTNLPQFPLSGPRFFRTTESALPVIEDKIDLKNMAEPEFIVHMKHEDSIAISTPPTNTRTVVYVYSEVAVDMAKLLSNAGFDCPTGAEYELLPGESAVMYFLTVIDGGEHHYDVQKTSPFAMMIKEQDVKAIRTALSTEINRAKAAEQANAAAIQAEATARSGAVGAEATAREAGDAAVAAALTVTDGKVVLNDEITAAVLANLNGRITAIEESIRSGFAGLTVDKLFVKTGMKAYMFNGETDDDALVVVRGYAPNIIPKHYGQRWFDTVAKKWYKPTGLASVADWVVDN